MRIKSTLFWKAFALIGIYLFAVIFEVNSMKLTRSDSSAKLSAYSDFSEDKDYFPKLTFAKYIEIAQKFLNDNKDKFVLFGIYDPLDDIKKQRELAIDAIGQLEKNFGSKAYAPFRLIGVFSSVFKKIKSSVNAEVLSIKTWKYLVKWVSDTEAFLKSSDPSLFESQNNGLSINRCINMLNSFKSKLEKFLPLCLNEKGIFVLSKDIADEVVKETVGDDIFLFWLDKSRDAFEKELITFLSINRENYQRVILLYFINYVQFWRDNVKGIPTSLPDYLNSLMDIAIDVPDIASTDISFPNLMNFAVKFTKENYEDLALNLKDPAYLSDEEPLNLINVLYIYKKFQKQIDRIVSGKGMENIPDGISGLSRDEMDWVLKLVIGKGSCRLFDVSSLKPEKLNHFKNSLKEILNNATGFQLILSLITADTLNRLKGTPFFKVLAGVKIKYKTNNMGSFATFDNSRYIVNIDKNNISASLSENAILVHELTHVYHWMINCSPRNIRNNSYVIFSILNNSLFNSCDRFFPIFKPSIMKKIVPDINTANIKEDDIFRIAVAAIKHGFGNILFGKIEDMNNLNIKQLMNNKPFVQTCVYLKKTVLPDADVGTDAIWNSIYEILTMQGYVPILDGPKCWIIEDRQNEQMYKVRELVNEKPGLKWVAYETTYRFHSNLADRLVSKFSPIMLSLTPAQLKECFMYYKKIPGESPDINIEDMKDYKSPMVKDIFESNGIQIDQQIPCEISLSMDPETKANTQ